MAATLEINYFNSFWIKKMDSIAQVKPTTAEIASDATSATQTVTEAIPCLLYTSPSPRDRTRSRMPSSA